MQLKELPNNKDKLDQRRNGKRRIRKIINFEIRIVPLDAYPDLVENPSNPYVKMSDEERENNFIEFLARIWAETLRETKVRGPLKTKQ